LHCQLALHCNANRARRAWHAVWHEQDACVLSFFHSFVPSSSFVIASAAGEQMSTTVVQRECYLGLRCETKTISSLGVSRRNYDTLIPSSTGFLAGNSCAYCTSCHMSTLLLEQEHGLDWHGMASHRIAWHCIAWQCMAWHGMAWKLNLSCGSFQPEYD
jgi:hypothetical protein